MPLLRPPGGTARSDGVADSVRDPVSLSTSDPAPIPSGARLARQVADLMRETADAVIMPRYQALAASEVREKSGPKDLVTIADIESERRMTPRLRALLPGSEVIGEEAVEERPELLGLLADRDAPVWVVDPVDGTRNFANGGKHFCVMVGLVQRDQPRLGVILDPLNESWTAAWEGGGAWRYTYGGGSPAPLSIDRTAAVGEMCGALNLRFLDPDSRPAVRERAGHLVERHYRLGCAGHEYLRLASGAAHFLVHGKNMPWDHVPGCLIHSEAGGVQARFDGRAYRPSELAGGLLAAPDRSSWRQLRDGLLGGVTPPTGV